jgi:hypothetical protein
MHTFRRIAKLLNANGHDAIQTRELPDDKADSKTIDLKLILTILYL